MACGTPVVAADEPALREVAGDAAVYAEDGDFAAAARRALAERERLSAAGIERARLFSWAETARRTVEVYRQVLGVKVSAIVVSHGNAAELARVAAGARAAGRRAARDRERAGVGPRRGRGARERPPARLRRQRQPRAHAHDAARRCSSRTPTPSPSPARSPRCATSWRRTPRCGVAGPRMVFPDGSPQPSRRRFPTVGGTIVRRTPLRKVVRQDHHFHLDEPPPTGPVEADWMLGGFLLLRRAMLDELGGFDAGFRLYGEDIDLQYRAMRAGWERWYVPAAVVRHEHKARDRPPLAHPADALALARHPALRAQASREAARPVSTERQVRPRSPTASRSTSTPTRRGTRPAAPR